MRYVAYVSLSIGFLAATIGAQASTVQLTSPSQLSSSDTTITFPTVSTATVVNGPQVYTGGGDTLTITNSTNKFEEDTVGVTYGVTGFPNGTNLLYSAGFNGATSPVTVTFANGVSEFGFNAEEFAYGNELFTLTAFDGAMPVGTFTATGNDPNSLAFLGVDASGGTVITSFTLSDASGNNIALGPISFAPAAATPEPSAFALLGTGLLGLGRFIRRRNGR